MKKLFLTAALGAAVAIAGATGALAGKVRLKIEATYPSKLVQLGSLGVSMVKTINTISNGTVQAKLYEPGALVPALELFDAVGSGAVDAAWSTPGYWQGKEPALALFASVPFGPSAGEYIAWMWYGGGEKMMQEIYHRHGLHSIMCGVIAPEASGWFRKPVKSITDLKGKKMRFFGLGAKVMQKLGVDTQLLAAADIYPALERGAIDATEFSMPAIDLKLGFYQIAKHYYFPGWHQQSTLFELLINKKKWDSLDSQQKAVLQTACKANVAIGLAEGEAIQFKAMKTLKEKGVTFHKWSQADLDLLRKTWEGVAAEVAAKNADFKKAWDSLQAFRKDYALWKEYGYLK